LARTARSDTDGVAVVVRHERPLEQQLRHVLYKTEMIIGTTGERESQKRGKR
jgi:hypothetical protein